MIGVNNMIHVTMGEKFTSKHDFRETCFGIYEQNNQLLLVKKKEQYSLVGGGMENGETTQQCLAREFKEEAGYEITEQKEIALIDCFWLAGGKWPMESLVHVFVVNVNLSNQQLPTEEGHTTKFVNANEAMNLLPLPYHKKALELYFNQKNNVN